MPQNKYADLKEDSFVCEHKGFLKGTGVVQAALVGAEIGALATAETGPGVIIGVVVGALTGWGIGMGLLSGAFSKLRCKPSSPNGKIPQAGA